MQGCETFKKVEFRVGIKSHSQGLMGMAFLCLCDRSVTRGWGEEMDCFFGWVLVFDFCWMRLYFYAWTSFGQLK